MGAPLSSSVEESQLRNLSRLFVGFLSNNFSKSSESLLLSVLRNFDNDISTWPNKTFVTNNRIITWVPVSFRFVSGFYSGNYNLPAIIVPTIVRTINSIVLPRDNRDRKGV